MKRKILSFVLTILTVASLVCALSITASAEETATPSVSIDKFNLVFEDNVYLKYAVKFGGVEDSAINSNNIGMLYFTTPKTDYTAGSEIHSSSVVGYTTIDYEKYYTFEYRHITAKQMTDYIYSVAYIDIDGVRYYSAPVKYSVLDYCYSKLGKTGVASDNEDFRNLLTATLEQGAMAQKYFKYNTDRLANDEYYLVEVLGGTLEDGFTKGLYHSSETATLTAPEGNGEFVFAGWENSAGETDLTDNPATFTGFTKNDTYTATYEEAVKYSEGIEYTSNGDGTCYVSGIGTCTDTEVIIPYIYNGEAVTSIGDSAFKNCTTITSISIPDTIINIGPCAFYWCSSLESITIPEGITNIENRAFYYCIKLDEINFNAVSMNDLAAQNDVFAYAGRDAENLTVTIGKNVTKIPSYLFCPDYYSNNTPANIKTVKFEAGGICKNVGTSVFYRCHSISEVYIYDIAAWSGIDFDDFLSNPVALADKVYVNDTLVTDIILPNTVSYIGNYAFSYFRSLKSITIPDSVTSIGNGAFLYCDSIENINIPNGVEKIGWNTFKNCSKLATIDIPDSVTSIENYAFSDCDSLETIDIPDGVTNIGNQAFYSCSNLTNITIPDSLISIGTDVFNYCTNIKFNIYNNAKYLGNINNPYLVLVEALGTDIVSCKIHANTKIISNAFINCKELTDITIPESVTNIGNSAFSGCTNLKSITIGKGVTNIGSYAFYNCSSLTNIYYTGSSEDWKKIKITYPYHGLGNATKYYNYVLDE